MALNEIARVVTLDKVAEGSGRPLACHHRMEFRQQRKTDIKGCSFVDSFSKPSLVNTTRTSSMKLTFFIYTLTATLHHYFPSCYMIRKERQRGTVMASDLSLDECSHAKHGMKALSSFRSSSSLVGFTAFVATFIDGFLYGVVCLDAPACDGLIANMASLSPSFRTLLSIDLGYQRRMVRTMASPRKV